MPLLIPKILKFDSKLYHVQLREFMVWRRALLFRLSTARYRQSKGALNQRWKIIVSALHWNTAETPEEVISTMYHSRKSRAVISDINNGWVSFSHASLSTSWYCGYSLIGNDLMAHRMETDPSFMLLVTPVPDNINKGDQKALHTLTLYEAMTFNAPSEKLLFFYLFCLCRLLWTRAQ